MIGDNDNIIFRRHILSFRKVFSSLMNYTTDQIDFITNNMSPSYYWGVWELKYLKLPKQVLKKVLKNFIII